MLYEDGAFRVTLGVSETGVGGWGPGSDQPKDTVPVSRTRLLPLERWVKMVTKVGVDIFTHYTKIPRRPTTEMSTAESETLLKESHEWTLKRYGSGHPTTFGSMMNLGVLYEKQGNIQRRSRLHLGLWKGLSSAQTR